jgi:hypothetical protein
MRHSTPLEFDTTDDACLSIQWGWDCSVPFGLTDELRSMMLVSISPMIEIQSLVSALDDCIQSVS